MAYGISLFFSQHEQRLSGDITCRKSTKESKSK